MEAASVWLLLRTVMCRVSRRSPSRSSSSAARRTILLQRAALGLGGG